MQSTIPLALCKAQQREEHCRQDNEDQVLPLLVDQEPDEFPEKRVRVEVGLGLGGDALGGKAEFSRQDVAAEHMVVGGGKGDIALAAFLFAVDHLLGELHILVGVGALVPTGAAGFHGLVEGNKSFSAIAECLQKDTTEEEIVDILCMRFNADREIIAADVAEAISRLKAIGAIDDEIVD